LLPVLDGTGIGAKISSEHSSGNIHPLTQGEDFFRRDVRAWTDVDGVRAQRSFALALFGKGIEAFGELIEQLVLGLHFFPALISAVSRSLRLGAPIPRQGSESVYAGCV